MNIDPTTGLPALPEGYFWKVAPHTSTLYPPVGKSYKEVRGYKVAICTIRPVTKTLGKKNWWSVAKVVTEDTVVEVIKKRLIDPEKKAAADEQYLKNPSVYWCDFYTHVHYDHITSEIIKEAAIELYSTWQENLEAKRVAKAKREVTEALLGAYPPKVLA